ncbi:hypothetical protein GCM10008943_00050 [Paenochrobactrum glaciei]|uniref:Uncharacterized protein n=1 Tax=Paenochrobactrum glaciei TaxID=486407 RepID=A0ABN1FE86_9HYPH
MATFYVVQSYSAAKGGFTADSPVPAQSTPSSLAKGNHPKWDGDKNE